MRGPGGEARVGERNTQGRSRVIIAAGGLPVAPTQMSWTMMMP